MTKSQLRAKKKIDTAFTKWTKALIAELNLSRGLFSRNQSKAIALRNAEQKAFKNLLRLLGKYPYSYFK